VLRWRLLRSVLLMWIHLTAGGQLLQPLFRLQGPELPRGRALGETLDLVTLALDHHGEGRQVDRVGWLVDGRSRPGRWLVGRRPTGYRRGWLVGRQPDDPAARALLAGEGAPLEALADRIGGDVEQRRHLVDCDRLRPLVGRGSVASWSTGWSGWSGWSIWSLIIAAWSPRTGAGTRETDSLLGWSNAAGVIKSEFNCLAKRRDGRSFNDHRARDIPEACDVNLAGLAKIVMPLAAVPSQLTA